MDFKRQHSYYLISKIFNDLKSVISLFIVYGIINIGKDRLSNIWHYGIILILIITLVSTITSWYRRVYKVDDNNIYSKSGIFVLKDVTIPFNKVQTIDITSTAIQRAFKVCKVQVETSGGNVAEKEFEVIISLEEALNIKRNVFNEEGSRGNTETHKENYKISTKDILIASLTSTQITIGFSVVFATYSFLSEKIPEKYKTYLFDTTNGIVNEYIGNQIIYKAIFIGTLLLALTLAISFIGMVLKYHNFSINRQGKNIKIKHGLLTTKEITIPINKVLYIDIKEGLIRRPLGLCEVKISSVGYGNESGEKAILCPLIKKKELFKLLKVVLKEVDLNYNINPVSKKSIFSYFIIYTIIDILICIVLSAVFKYGYLSFLVIILLGYIRFLSYRENGIDYNDKFLYISVRHIALHTIIVPKGRVQGVIEVSHYLSNKNNMKKIKFQIKDTLSIKQEAIKGMDKAYVDEIINWYKWKKVTS